MAAETINNDDIQSNSPHTSGSNDDSTITITAGTKRKSDSVQDEQKKKKKRVYKICSTEGCTNFVVSKVECVLGMVPR